MRYALLLVLLFANLASADIALAGKNDAEWNPPSRFDHAYSGELIVLRLPQAEVAKMCASLFDQYNVKAKAYPEQRGCSAITTPHSCLVFVSDKTFKGASPDAILRHETGHCNGWPADHPE